MEKICTRCGSFFEDIGKKELCPDCKRKKRNRTSLRHYYKVRVPKQAHCSVCGKEVSGRSGKRLCGDCDKEAARIRSLARYHKNAAKMNRAAYLKNREKPEFWERHKKNKQTRRARELGLERSLTTEQWKSIVDAFGGKCAYCGAESKLQQDHFVPLSLGGGYTKENIVPACRSCNSRKNGKHPLVWLKDRMEVYNFIVSMLTPR